nr:MAG TPA: hypothetical protein [Bacteriophage sp.]
MFYDRIRQIPIISVILINYIFVYLSIIITISILNLSSSFHISWIRI